MFNTIELLSIEVLMRKAPQKVTLVAVTKYVGVEEANEAIRAGVTAIGENRVEDFEKKVPQLLPVEKHFIGQIQSRKIKRIVELFDVIQSVSSIEHLKMIDHEAQRQRKEIRVLLQFNISGEEQKAGFKQDELDSITMLIDSLSVNSRELTYKNNNTPNPEIHRVQIIGVMGMASRTDDEEILRKQFRLLKVLRDKLRDRHPTASELSMGMSGDYKIALEEGATMLRIGQMLFGATK